MRIAIKLAAVALLASLIAHVAPATAAPAAGTLDPTFDGDGIATTRIGITTDEGRAVAIQPDGRVVVAGVSNHQGLGQLFTTVRFNDDGTLDESFDGDGVVTHAFDGSLRNEAYAVAVDPAGRIVVAGETYPAPNTQPSIKHAAVARYLPDGTLDPSFGGDGTVSTPLGMTDSAQAVAVTPSGQIVIAGISSPFSSGGWMTLARYNVDGSLDPAFGGGDGIVFTDLGSSSVALAMQLAPDGSIVVAGRTVFGNFELVVARYLPNGDLDPNFGGLGVRPGVTVTDVGFTLGLDQASTDSAVDLRLMDDGRAVISGLAQSSRLGGSRAVLLRYDLRGHLDSTFGTRGIVVAPTGIASGEAVAIDGNARVLVAGDSFNGGNFDFRMFRYHPDGTLDPAFGAGGVVTTPVSAGNDRVRGMAIQVDGRIVLTGFADLELAAVRYHGDPAPTHVLSVVTSGSGAGSVTSDPAGIDCGSDCSEVLPAGTAVTLTASPAAGSIFEGWTGDCSGMGTCTVTLDADRNVTATFAIAPDTVPPMILLTTPADDAQYLLGQTVLADYVCNDETGGTGVVSCQGTVADGSAIETTSVGLKSFTVTAEDDAGNSSSLTHDYRVVYEFSGFFHPVDNPPTFNIANAGRAIPMRFSLGGDHGLDVLAEGSPTSTRIDCDGSSTGDTIEETVNVGSGLTYKAETDEYQYLWKTSREWAGSCRLFDVELADGTHHSTIFQFR